MKAKHDTKMKDIIKVENLDHGLSNSPKFSDENLSDKNGLTF